MKLHLNRILVVEGKEDASYLSNYISSEIVTTNGFEIPKEKISYLKDKKVIVLTDPDEAGKKIRQKLNELLPNSINVDVDIKKCVRNTKSGVAECDINEVLTKLKPYIIEQIDTKSDITISDLYDLGLMNNKDLREQVCTKLKLGKCNAKTMYKRLLNNNIKLEQLYEIMKKVKNGN